MKLHRKIRIVYADIRIYADKPHMLISYEKSTHVCHLIRLMILKTLIVQIVSVYQFKVMI